MKRFIISESEKQRILNKHAKKGLSLSEKISDLYDMDEEFDDLGDSSVDQEMYEEDEDMDFEYGDMDEIHDKIDVYEAPEGSMIVPNDRTSNGNYGEQNEYEDLGSMDNPKYEKSLKGDDEEDDIIYELEFNEQEEEEDPFEKGPRGMRAARTRADFDPTAREIEMSGVFGKHGEDVPPTTLRYMRKNPGTIIKRLADMYGTDKIKNWLNM